MTASGQRFDSDGLRRQPRYPFNSGPEALRPHLAVGLPKYDVTQLT